MPGTSDFTPKDLAIYAVVVVVAIIAGYVSKNRHDKKKK